MSNLDPLIATLSPGKKSFTRDQFLDFIRNSLQQVVEINDAYKKFFESPDPTTPTVFAEIESKVAKIRDEYSSLFASSEDEDSVITELDEKIEAIRAFHTELLEGGESTQANIAAAQSKINSFYNFLFGDGIDNEGVHEKTKVAIDEILNSQQSISKFEAHLNEKIKPSLVEVQKDLDTKRKEAGALLSNVTINTLLHGYSESKYEYSKPAPRKYSWNLHSKLWYVPSLLSNGYALVYNLIWRHLGFLLSYTLFILPLVGVSIIFITEGTARIVLESLAADVTTPSALELIYVKTIISVPLIWVAWYGQRNISQRKRLYEEYNHKLRVVQMYVAISSDKEAYPFKDKSALENVLLEVIERNPSEVFGKDETILDKIGEIVLASKGFVKDAEDAIKKGIKIPPAT